MRLPHGFLAAFVFFGSTLAGRAALEPDPSRYEREVLVAAADDPLSLDIAPDGRVFFVERQGAVKLWDPRTRAVTLLGVVPTHVAWDTGMLAVLLDRDFARTGFLYVLHCPEDRHLSMRVTRLGYRDGRLDLGGAKTVIEWPIEGEEPPHTGGGLGWDGTGHLLVGTGDNTPPQDVPAFDPGEGRERFDARRSAANSMDLRGKILRIRLEPDGSYAIPPGNLFTDPARGRPEIFAMGVRNGFRVSGDPKTGWIVWGDVGGNVETGLGLGPEGYDEINLAKGPGFFGWPFGSGPNEAWRPFDSGTKTPVGPAFDMSRLVNDSRANAGIRQLPPAQPALIYYPTVASERWPELGSGGRSITGGPIYRYLPALESPVKLPAALDGCLIFAEWMRNWIMVARLTPEGGLAGMEPFMAGTVFRKPSDLKIGPDGALYVVEYGDRFGGNRDGQITRCVYRWGNRAPVARVVSTRHSGALPLAVTFSGADSSDPDGDPLRYRWKFPNGTTAEGRRADFQFEQSGRWGVELEVEDGKGGRSVAQAVVVAGNSAPEIRFESPADGGFFAWDRPVRWVVRATDPEEGELPAERVMLQLEQRDRRVAEDPGSRHPGLGLMRTGTCFACHSATEKSAGPPYIEVARRYAGDDAARDRLARKVVTGGLGVWGPVPMPPHPQHSQAQARLMVDWILSLASKRTVTLPPGLTGETKVEAGKGREGEGVVILTAAATDRGAGAAPALRGEAVLALRTRRQRAAYFDAAERTTYQENLGDGLVARVQAGGWVTFQEIHMAEVREIVVRGRCVSAGEATVSVRLDAGPGDAGRLLGSHALRSGGGGRAVELRYPSTGIRGRHAVRIGVESGASGVPAVAELLTVEFGE